MKKQYDSHEIVIPESISSAMANIKMALEVLFGHECRFTTTRASGSQIAPPIVKGEDLSLTVHRRLVTLNNQFTVGYINLKHHVYTTLLMKTSEGNATWLVSKGEIPAIIDETEYVIFWDQSAAPENSNVKIRLATFPPGKKPVWRIGYSCKGGECWEESFEQTKSS